MSPFDFEKPIKIRIWGTFMASWKSLVNLKEIKKPSDKILLVWAKNQLRFEIFGKILKFTYRNLNGKVIFYPFSLLSSRTFVILCTSATYQNLWVGWGRSCCSGFGGVPLSLGGWGVGGGAV